MCTSDILGVFFMANRIMFGLVLVGLLSGVAFAISNATTTTIYTNRWDGIMAQTALATTGGNITGINIATTQLTKKWASFNGNVTGNIVLGTNTANVYSWTYVTSAGGKVCVSTNGTQSFATPITAVVANINTAFNTTGAPDDAAGTFNTTCPTLNIATGPLAGFIAAKTQGSSTFTTCAATITGATAIGNHFFCTSINGTPGKNYLNNNANFEIIAPAGAFTGTTYYFFAELM